MKYLSPFRLASYLLVVFFAGHTAGGMLAQKSHGPDADAVFASMKAVHFTFKRATTTQATRQVISAPRASETCGGFL